MNCQACGLADSRNLVWDMFVSYCMGKVDP